MAPNRLGLEVRDIAADEDGEVFGGIELVINVDGVEAFDWGMGMEPNALLNPEMPLLPPVDGTAVRRAVQRCGCGEVGCGSLRATIQRVGDRIDWSDILDGDRSIDAGPWSFDAGAYETEVRRANDDRPWEVRAMRVARLVAEMFRHERDARPVAFHQAVGEGDDAVYVSVFEYRPNPNAGTRERMRGGWHSVEPDELMTQHMGIFPIISDDDGAAAARIVDAIRTVPKAAWTKPSWAVDR